VLYFTIYHCLLWVQKIKNQRSSAIFKKSKVNFLLEVILFLWTKAFKHIFAFVLMQMFACLKEYMRELIDYVFCALCMVCPGSAVSWNRQDCNRQSMQQVENTWSIGTGLFLNARTQIKFSKQPFPWFWSWEITKGPQALTAKPATAIPEIVHITVIFCYVSANNCSLNRLNLWLFFHWVPHGKTAACEKLSYWLTQKSLVQYILLVLCTW